MSRFYQFLSLIIFCVLLCSCENMQPMLQVANQIAQARLVPSEAETTEAIKQALNKGVDAAINKLGRQDAFYQTGLKIVLPEQLSTAGEKARQFGLGKYVDDFEQSMNRAAEKAVPVALSILNNSIKQMTLSDVISIMQGGEEAATDYFKRTTRQEIFTKFLPIVSRKTQEVGVTRQYKKLAEKVNTYGRLAGLKMPQSVELDRYITDKAIDALFLKIAEKEQTIRQNPWGESSELIQKVFGYYR